MAEALFEVGHHVRAMAGHVHSGDFAIVAHGVSQSTMVLIDVSGHGYTAYSVGCPVYEKLAALARVPTVTPTELLQAADKQFRSTQGAAVGVAIVRESNAVFAGVGNIQCQYVPWNSLLHTGSRHLRSQDGLVGVRFPEPLETEVAFGPSDLLLMHSDGIRSDYGRWRASELHRGDANQVARNLVECHGVSLDDASCIVIRHGGGGQR